MAHQVADLVDQFVRLDAFLMDFIFEAAMKLASITGKLLSCLGRIISCRSVFLRRIDLSINMLFHPFFLSLLLPPFLRQRWPTVYDVGNFGGSTLRRKR